MTAAGREPCGHQAQTTGLPNEPFAIDTTFGLPTSVITRDLRITFLHNQMQINGGKNDKFAALFGCRRPGDG
jgi:phospholipase C